MRVNRPKITLSPWEVAPNVEIRPKSIGSFFDVRVAALGRSRPVGTIKHPVTTDGYHFIFLRFLDEEDEGNWIISSGFLRSWGKGRDIKLPWHLDFEKIGDHLQFKRLFNACSLGVASDDGLIITVGSYNSGLCIDIRDPYHSARFRLNSESKLIFNVPFAVVKESLQREMSLAESDAGFTLRWMALPSSEEQFRFIYRTKHGNWDELTALIRAVDALFPSSINKFFPLTELNIEWVYEPINGVPDLLVCRRYFWNLELIRYFQPFVAPELRHYTCVRDWLKTAGEIYVYWEEQVSAHEKIEAANLLFNWAQDKMSAKKLKLLLSF